MTLVSSVNSNSAIAEQIETTYKLAYIWLSKGKFKQAIAGFQKVLKLQPDHLEAAIHLDYAQQQQAWYGVRADLGQPGGLLQENASGKLNLIDQKVFFAHRCGWNYALHALKPLHNSQGVLFDGFLEDTFVWQDSPEQVRQPYKEPWIGFLHNPPGMPTWYFSDTSPQALLANQNWQQSLSCCKGLFTLSEYHAEWLRKQVDIPVSSLIHPTELPELQFDWNRFVVNPKKKIIQLGWWLRKLAAIYQLPIPKNNPLNYQKIKLNPAPVPDSEKYLQNLLNKQIELEQIALNPAFVENTLNLTHVSNQKYDELLSENIGFIELYDASANNAVIECIARATPLLINPLPAVVEYLGTDYPMYFNSLSEAAEKAMDMELIRLTHEYLKTCETRRKLTADYFLKSFQESEVYRLIP